MAAADVNGDGMADIITGAGPSGGPHVRAFSLAGGGVTEVASFYAYDPSFTGGVFVAGGDVNGDGIAEIITGTTRAGGPVRVFTIGGPGRVAELASFFAYIPAFQGPVRVAAADVNGDGRGGHHHRGRTRWRPACGRLGSRRRWPDDARQLLRV